MKRVFVCCPGNSVTGGPELLHQFVDELRNNNIEAYILYYPFNIQHEVPEPYAKYNVKVCCRHDVNSSDVVVLPEIKTRLAKEFPLNRTYIWWLSVDNYFKFKGVNPAIEKIRYAFRLLKGKQLSFSMMKKMDIRHIVQCQYAMDFLAKKNIESTMLTDYINDTHLTQNFNISNKKRIITYNPKKGFGTTQKLMKKFPFYQFFPIENMTRDQVAKLLQSAMIYIDFGRHPGKDRFPREAAMAGCCIITGKEGSAKNDIDVPIPKEYKLDIGDNQFEDKFNRIVDRIYKDIDTACQDFNYYRESIKEEKIKFKAQVKKFISEIENT